MMRLFISVAMLSMVMVSCRDIKEPEFIGIENIKMGQLGISETKVRLDVRYFNPNKFNAKLKGAEGDAWVDSAYLGHFTVDSLISIPAKTEFLVPVNLGVDMKYMLKNSMTAFSKEEVHVRIEGTARAGRNGIYKTIPIKYQGKQNIQKLLNNQK
jgi:LEA14-like dessication related protein